jgi:hypothetical protein
MSAGELLAFYRARLADDELIAKGNGFHSIGCANHGVPSQGCTCDYSARVRTEVAAKRAIADAWEQLESERPQLGGDVFGYEATGLLIAIKHLVTAWSDHPDYRVDWRA